MHLPTPEELRIKREQEVDITQQELAERADVSQPLIARIEGGDVDPRMSTLRRIVETLMEAEGSIVRAADLRNRPVSSVRPDDSVEDAQRMMDEEGFSQLPVILDGTPKGLIDYDDIIEKRKQHDETVGKFPVDEVMHESVQIVEPEKTLPTIETYLDHHDAVLVVEDGETTGIITKADIARHVS